MKNRFLFGTLLLSLSSTSVFCCVPNLAELEEQYAAKLKKLDELAAEIAKLDDAQGVGKQKIKELLLVKYEKLKKPCIKKEFEVLLKSMTDQQQIEFIEERLSGTFNVEYLTFIADFVAYVDDKSGHVSEPSFFKDIFDVKSGETDEIAMCKFYVFNIMWSQLKRAILLEQWSILNKECIVLVRRIAKIKEL